MLPVEKRKFLSAIVVMVMAALLAKSSESAAVTPRCSGKMDVLFIVDGSSSVGETDFQTGLVFSANLSEQFTVGPNDVQFSFMTYSTRNYNVFGFQDHLTNDRVKQAILSVSYPGGLTNTGSALRNARTYSFGPANGARTDVFQVAVVMTDGQSNDATVISGINVRDTKVEALLLRILGVTVVTLGVGSAVDLEELQTIASSPSLAFSVSSYTTLSSIKNELSSKLCEEQTKEKQKTCGSFSCVGKRDGNYPACSPECQQGFYYSCSNEYNYKRPCPLGWYTAANETHFTAPMVYDPRNDRCELEVEYCPRETERYSVPPPNPGNANSQPSNQACIDSSSNCGGRQNGNYPICHPDCQSGFYYSCSNNYTYLMPCALGWYTDANNNSYTARMVYDARSDSCQLSTPSCPRDSLPKSDETEATPATTRCNTSLSLLFILDSSGSIGTQNYKIMLQFASSIASFFSVGVDNSRISAITFSNSAKTLFDFSTYSKTEDVRQALENAPYDNGGTETHLALDLARQLICSPTSGAPDNLPKVVILLTDGISNNSSATEAAAKSLKNCSVTVLSVGIGSGANQRELLAVATSPEHVYEVDNATSLSRIRSGLVNRTCNNVNPQPSNRACINSTSNCAGRQNGNYPICHPDCQSGFYYSCSNNYTYLMPCAPGWYTDAKNNSYTARMVYDAGSDSCQLSTSSCPRDSPPKSDETETTQAPIQCNAQADIAFIMDSSGSVSSDDFDKMKTFAASVVDHFTVASDGVQFSVIKFSSDATIEFKFTDYSTATSVKQAIQRISYRSGGTNTAAALKLAREQVFTSTGGARMNVSHIAIVLTDGGSNDPNETALEAGILKTLANIFCVGIGSGINVQELRTIASSPNQTFNATSFDVLDQIKSALVTSTCRNVISPPSNRSCINSTSNCAGRQNGNYPICHPDCQSGFYYSCSNNYTYLMPCALGWYTDANNNSYTARMVYDAGSDSCQLSTPSCPRDSPPKSDETEATPATTPCNTSLSLLFILDSSGSIGTENYKIMLQFASSIASFFSVGVDNSRISAITFSDSATILFDFSTYSKTEDVRQALENARYDNGGTETHLALDLARQLICSPTAGAPDNLPKVVILLTDGISNNPSATEAAAVSLKNCSVTVLSVGIGSGANQRELLAVATSPEHVYEVDNATSLSRIRSGLVNRTCNTPIQCKAQADIAFIMDSSGSVSSDDFDKMKTFAASVVDHFTVASDGVQFSVIKFSSDATIEFKFTDYSTATSVKQAIQRISYRSGGTNTAAALKLAREQVFTSTSGARMDVSHIAIVLTDGGSNDPNETALEAGILKTLANIFCVGIGSGINMQELRTIASSPNQTFNATSFDVLDRIKSALVNSTCQNSGPKTSEPPPSCVVETCEGLAAGTYPACGQLCKEGYYFVCANQQVYRKSCPPVWYTSQNNTSFQARSVFDPTSQACQRSSNYCQRDPELYKV